MPLDEEGAKWSCEPCVRGHRSSKCQHFDRMMMKVPKAGRPLAKCPHPTGSCSCQKLYAFMVRIPKGSTCLCRPLYKVPMAASETGQSPSTSAASPALPDHQTATAAAAAAAAGASAMPPPAMPLPAPPPPAAAPVASPTTKGTTGNKVQKAAKRENNVRDLSELSAKDLSAHPAIVSVDQTSHIAPNTDLHSSTPLASTFVPAPYSPATMGHGATVYPAAYYHPHYSAHPESLAAPIQKSHSEPASTKGSSCCSANKPPTVGVAAGCCSSGNGVDTQQQTPIEPQKETTHQPVQDGQQHALNNHQYYSYPYPYPYHHHHPPHSAANWPSLSGPLKHGLPHLDTAAAHPAASAPVSGYASPNIKPQRGSVNHLSGHSQAHSAYTQAFQMVSDQNHNCGCGDGCQCLGCASHPFNDTTRQHIQEMGYLMAIREESPKENPSSPYTEKQQQPYPTDFGYPQNPPFHVHHHYHQPNLSAQSDTANNNIFEHTANLPDTSTDDTLASVPSAAAATTANGIEGGEGMLTMQPGAYLTVEYPVGLLDPCSNLSGTCQCGSNCACVGCLTHNGHNGVPLGPSPPPEDADFAPIPTPSAG